MKKIRTQALTETPLNTRVTIVRLANSSNEFLKYLDKVGLTIGDSLELAEIEEFDRSVTVLHKKTAITLSREAASNLLVTIE